MASRTKSFFEQENSSNKSKFFPRNRFPSHRGVLAETSLNAPQPKAAFPPSAETKNKLKAFQFVSSQEASKTNATTEQPQALDLEEDVEILANPRPIASTMDGSEHSHGNATVTPQLRHANTFPCTPNARLPLEELIGNCDATKKAAPAEESPEEQIKWLPNSSANHITPNHKRKRARSSSPTCPLTCSQQQFQAQGGLAEQASAEKVTPEADPAADLWRRYANGRAVDDLGDLTKIAMEGSPRPLLETPVRSGGFRRWVSTGNDWPKSRNKRLCTSTRANINLWQDQTAVEVVGKSKVAAMVQKIQESLSTQSLDKAQQHDEGEEKADAPSSSSPLPETKTHQQTQGSGFSPLPKKQQSDRALQKPPGMQALLSNKNVGIAQRTTDGDRSDVVFPAQRQQVLDPNLPGSAPLHFQNKVALPAYKRPSITRVPSQPKVQPVAAPKPTKTTAIPSDEFGDEFDLTVDDLDEIMADIPVSSKQQPQNSIQPRIAHNATQESIRKPIALDDDDEFGGGDIDEDDFAQAEICATQAARVSRP